MSRPSFEPGDQLPDMELPDHAGNARRLMQLAGDDPVLVHFYRGWWCPKEQAFFRRLVAVQEEAEVAYTRFVSVSVDPPPVTAAFRAGVGARWTFLSDDERRWIDRLGLVETTDPTNMPFLPTVFVVFPDLRIHSRYDGYWFWGRPTVEELQQDFRAVSQQLRADWDPPRS